MVAIPAAALIVSFALSIDVPLLLSSPSLATYNTFGAELIPDATALMVTLSPRITSELVIVTTPTLTFSLSPSIVIDAVPIVRIPVTLASPLTRRAVCAVPALTIRPLLNVLMPRESTCLTSSYVIVPATLTLPVASMSPTTNSEVPAFA